MIHVKLTIMALVWAGGFVAGKIITDHAGPFSVAFFRFLIATVALTAVLSRNHNINTKINLKLFALVAIAAFVGEVCYNYFFFSGIKLTQAGSSSVILSVAPILMFLTSCFVFREKIRFMNLLGVLLSLFGAWFVIANGNWDALLSFSLGKGEIYLLGCVVCVVVFAFLSKQILKSLTPVASLVYLSALGTIFLSGPAVIEMQQMPVNFLSTPFLSSLLYLAIGPSVIAVMFYYEGIAQVGAARATQYMNLIPVFSVIFAFLILGEEISSTLFVGGGLVTAGLYLAK